MSKNFGQWVPISKNGEQIGIWVDPSLSMSKGGILGVRTDDRSFLSTGDNGVTATVGDGATVTTGSPRRLVVSADPQVAKIARVVDTHTTEIAAKASQADMEAAQASIDTLNSTKASTDAATKGSVGLVLQAVDPGDVSTGAIVLLSDAIVAITELRTKMNDLMQAKRDAGQLG